MYSKLIAPLGRIVHNNRRSCFYILRNIYCTLYSPPLRGGGWEAVLRTVRVWGYYDRLLQLSCLYFLFKPFLVAPGIECFVPELHCLFRLAGA